MSIAAKACEKLQKKQRQHISTSQSPQLKSTVTCRSLSFISCSSWASLCAFACSPCDVISRIKQSHRCRRAASADGRKCDCHLQLMRVKIGVSLGKLLQLSKSR
jgi:hypothetical protein